MKRNALRNKKGNMVFDFVLVIFIMLFYAIVIVLGNYINTSINDELQADDDLRVETKESFNSTTQTYPNYMDSGFVLLYILLWIFIITSSYYIDISPLFLGISIIFMFIIVSVAMVFSNTYSEFIGESDITAFASEFPKTNYILEHLAVFIVIMIATAIIAMYAKTQNE